MEALKFADSHNMVAYLEKSIENADFNEIVNFLNANPIRYALTNGKATTTASSLEAEQDSGNIIRTQSMATLNESIPQGTSSVNALRSGKDNMKLNELMEICTKLSERVLALENIKTAKDLEITNLKKRFQEDAETQGRYGHDIEINIASTSITTASINITTAEPVTIASVPITTTSVFVSNAEPKKSKEKGVSSETATRLTRGVIMKEASKTAIRPIVPPQQQLDPKDKEKEERLAKQEEEDVNIAEWDDVQAMMDVDYELAARLQREEQGELTVEEKSKLFIKRMDKRKKPFATLRAKKQRRKPPTKTQKRNQMCTYMKNMAGFTHNQLKNKSFDEVQRAFDKTMSWINSFVPMDSEVVEGSRKEAVSKKRAGEKLGEERVKRQKVEDDAEREELKACLEIVPGDDSAVNVESLAIKYPIIFSAMLDDFDRQDVLDLYRLVKERFEITRPKRYDRLLWVDLITLFEPSEEDEIWKTQQDYTLISWRLYDSCGGHLLLMDTGIAIHIMVEKKYPLTQEMLLQMLSGRLKVDHECEMAYELIRFVKSQYKK
ncbi:hypothetical protein Tco_0277693 [Tanacetum coccineum]